MRFCIQSVYLLGILLVSPHIHAAEQVLPASSPGIASIASEKTVYIEAQEVVGKKDAKIEANGNVELQQGTQKVFAEHILYEQDTGDLFANGAVRVEQPTGSFSGPAFKTNTNSHVSEMTTPVFEQLQSGQGSASHGSALSLRSTGPSYYIYDHASFTTCPAGNDDWLLHMSEFDMDRTAQIGTAHNAWIEFEGVPMLYTPWLSFPLDGARHSGILAPVYSNTSIGGVEFTIPFYWNIAPNYDLTVADRNMSKRGTMLQNEFRFMEPGSAGIIQYDEISNDHVTNSTRYHATLMESQKFSGGFSALLNLNRVSDNNYFRDLSVALADVSQTQLLNEGVLSYAGGGVTASMRAQSFQTIQDILGDVAIPYQRMPQVNLAYQKNIADTAISVVNEYVDFRHPTLVEGQRLVLYPSLTYSLINDTGIYIKPKLGVNFTQYSMGANNTANIPDTVRTLPIFTLDSGMIFERDLNFGQSEFVQTLEPRIYYVRIPYQNQDLLPVYDTSQATLSFAQMFSENRFYGNDRIGDANMATAGLTTRLIDGAGGVERLHVGVAERFNFTAPQVNLVTPDANPNSDILFSIGGKLTNALTLDTLLDYSPYKDTTRSQSSSVRLSYKPEVGKLLNLGYNLTSDPVTPTNDVRQADFSAQWPLIWRWNAVSRISYSLQQNLLTERLLGLEYNRACWALRLVAEKFWYSETSSSTGIYIQLELTDLVSVGTNPISELRTQIPGYTKLNDSKLIPTTTPVQVMP